MKMKMSSVIMLSNSGPVDWIWSMQRRSRHYGLSWTPVRVMSHRRDRTPFTHTLQGRRWDWIIFFNATNTHTPMQIHFFMIIVSPRHLMESENRWKMFVHWWKPSMETSTIYEWSHRRLCILKCFPKLLICTQYLIISMLKSEEVGKLFCWTDK